MSNESWKDGYDAWKLRSPDDELGTEPDDPEDEKTELDLAYDALALARRAVDTTQTRIRRLEADLEECLAYFKNRYDVADGPDGTQRPNEEMRLGQMIEHTLHGIPF